MLIHNPPGVVGEEINIVVHEDGPLGVILCQLHDSGTVVVEALSDQHGPLTNKVFVGDALISVNELPIELMTYAAVMEMIKSSNRPMVLTFVKGTRSLLDELKRYVSEKAMMIQRKENERRRDEDKQRMQVLITKSTSPKLNDPKIVYAFGNEGESEELLQVRTYNANDIRSPRVLSQFQRRLAVILALLFLIILFSTMIEEEKDQMLTNAEKQYLYDEGHVRSAGNATGIANNTLGGR